MHPKQVASSLKLTHQFDIWFLSHLQSVSINGFALGVDLMVFTMTHIDGDNTFHEHRLKIFGLGSDGPRTPNPLAPASDIQSVLHMRRLFFPWDAGHLVNEYTEYFTLLHYFFHDPKRSGKYFMSGARYANGVFHCVKFLFDAMQIDTRDWDEHQWVSERETLYLAMEYATFFLDRATAEKNLFELLQGTATIQKASSVISGAISAIEVNARCRLNSRIAGVIFGRRTSDGDLIRLLQSGGTFYHIYPFGDRNVAKWQERSVQMVATAMSEYLSSKCRSFFPQTYGIQNQTLMDDH